jgi:NADPH2:quinone reductase
LNHLYGLVADGRARPIIGGRFPLAQVADAHRALESRDTVGKVLLTMSA